MHLFEVLVHKGKIKGWYQRNQKQMGKTVRQHQAWVAVEFEFEKVVVGMEVMMNVFAGVEEKPVGHHIVKFPRIVGLDWPQFAIRLRVTHEPIVGEIVDHLDHKDSQKYQKKKNAEAAHSTRTNHAREHGPLGDNRFDSVVG